MNYDGLIIFILSHKSPYKCETLDTLKRLNFKGKCFILIDDEDDFLDEYKKIYGDSLVVFHKKKYYDIVDLGVPTDRLPSTSHPVFARNAIEDIVEEMGLDYYILADDDINDFKYRVPIHEYKKLPVLSINDINYSLNLYKEFMMCNNISCVGVGTSNIYIGGYDKIVSGSYLTRRCVSNFYMRNIKAGKIKWLMPIDDTTTSYVQGVIGNLFLTLSPLEVIVRPQYIQKSDIKEDGMVDFYRNTSSFERSYYTYMILPSFIKVKYYKNHFIPQMNKEYSCPKIISSQFKKY